MSNEDLARSVIMNKLNGYINTTHQRPNADMIDKSITDLMDTYKLSLSNYYRLRRFLLDYYAKVII